MPPPPRHSRSSVLLALLASSSMLLPPDYQTLERPRSDSVTSKTVVREFLYSIVPRNRSGPFKPPRPSSSFSFP